MTITLIDPSSYLQTLDKAKFSRFHIRAIVVSGAGFLTDAYDIFVINLIVPMLGIIYFPDGKTPIILNELVKTTTPVGTFLGQILFGYLADRVGRKKMYGVELIIIITATLGSAFCGDTKRGIGILPILALWRLVLGFGIGGDYPLSAVITSEFATVKYRGLMIAAVFAMQGVGILLAALISTITMIIFRSSIERDPFMLDYVWRLIVGFGCIPACIALYYRLTIPESPRYTADVELNIHKAISNTRKVIHAENVPVEEQSIGRTVKPNTWKDFRQYFFGKWKNFKILFAACICWFLLDIAFYGLTLNQSMVLDIVAPHKNITNEYERTWNSVKGNLIISSLGTVPGYWFTVFLVERMGRIKIQLLGFAMLTILFVTLSIMYPFITARPILFLVIYGLAQFFFNFGPNATTFIIPGEVFPTRWRSTAHGLCSASGKLGAILASATFPSIAVHYFRILIGILSIIMALGFIFTFLLPETRGRTLEEISSDQIETQ